MPSPGLSDEATSPRWRTTTTISCDGVPDSSKLWLASSNSCCSSFFVKKKKKTKENVSFHCVVFSQQCIGTLLLFFSFFKRESSVAWKMAASFCQSAALYQRGRATARGYPRRETGQTMRWSHTQAKEYFFWLVRLLPDHHHSPSLSHCVAFVCAFRAIEFGNKQKTWDAIGDKVRVDVHTPPTSASWRHHRVTTRVVFLSRNISRRGEIKKKWSTCGEMSEVDEASDVMLP